MIPNGRPCSLTELLNSGANANRPTANTMRPKQWRGVTKRDERQVAPKIAALKDKTSETLSKKKRI